MFACVPDAFFQIAIHFRFQCKTAGRCKHLKTKNAFDEIGNNKRKQSASPNTGSNDTMQC